MKKENYLLSLQKNSPLSCMTICNHTPKCSYQLNSYFCRLSYNDARMLLQYFRTNVSFSKIIGGGNGILAGFYLLKSYDNKLTSFDSLDSR